MSLFRLNTVRPQRENKKINNHVNPVGVYLSQAMKLVSSTLITMVKKNTVKR